MSANWEPSTKCPDEFQEGDEITVRPLGKCTVKESQAAGNYHTETGWQLTVESPAGESVLSFTLISLKGTK